MKKIFISYAREDYEIARKLFDDLKEVAEPWLDRECLLPGERWKTGIKQAIKETDFFLALLSSRSVPKKGFVQTELDTALNELRNYPPDQIYIIPARLDKCIPKHEILHDLNWVDLFPSYEAGLEKILLVLEAYKEPDEAAQVSEPPSNQEIKLSDNLEIPIKKTEPKPEKEPASELEKQPETKQEPESETEIIELENVVEPSSEPEPPVRSEYTEKPKPHIPKPVLVKKRRTWKPVFAVLFVLLAISAYFIAKSYFPAKDTSTVEIKDENHIERIEPEEEKPPVIAKLKPVIETVKAEPEITNSLRMKFVYIKAGTFTMGSPENEKGRDSDEKQHRVTLTKGFYMQTTEVTQRQWKAIMGSNLSNFKGCEECPVENVSWNDTQEFIKKLNQKGEGVYSLPTEAEWEYAARAGTDTPFYFGKCLSTDQVNYNGNYPLKGCPKGEYRKKTTPVASFKANLWGLYDMHGNVWEWCQDWYSNYPSTAVSDPSGPKTGSLRVNRGGSWVYNAGYCRSACRRNNSPDNRNNGLGFRLSREHL
ncbi:MAG: SUMF1/EgtB/PvdO family nonheme iron enzyme [Desulfobacteraceae bacterium]|nr:SUMF1/EgtB/PvdO family nonheme iron enzyme [Desulfobacteraceae bacterium]